MAEHEDRTSGARQELHKLEHAVESHILVPAWRRITRGEPRWPVSLAVVAAVAMQVSLPGQVAVNPRWLLPGLEAGLLIGLVIANPRRIDRESPPLRAASLVLIAVMSLANIWSAVRLVDSLLRATNHQAPDALLVTGGAIWLTNVLVFSLWYWELDRSGPVARAHATSVLPDLLFPQMQNPEFAPPDWEPQFVDYLYLAFTNAAAFSPTDVMPLSRWTKMAMMLQSAVSLSLVALVIARAVNILNA
ncbi:MAG: hypothetical protein ACYDH6_14370 [Acidimicrobiales bacterium]